MRYTLFAVVMVPASLALMAGCATKDWVREVMGQKGAEVDRRFETVDVRVSDGAQRVDGLGSKMEGIGSKVTTLETDVQQVGATAKGAGETARRAGDLAQAAGDAAKGAAGRAEGALARAEEVDQRVTRLASKRFARDVVDTQHLQFAFNSADLTDAAQTSLLSIVRELQNNPTLSVSLEGYTDGSGDRGYNVQLSQRRVEAVRRYLAERGVDLPRVSSIGLGPLPDRSLQAAQKRRVTVKLMTQQD